MVASLRAGIAHFSTSVVPEKAELFAELATGQSPKVLFITCADSRIDPSLITSTEPGDIFVVRNAGNIVPPLDDSGSSADGNAASIEYAVVALGVTDVVVCGHSACGAMAGLQDLSGLGELPSVQRWLEHATPLLDGGADADLDSLIEQNVLLQLKHLASYPFVAERLKSGDLELHGWVYDIGSGVIRSNKGETFQPLLDASA